jgi:hypothetical protein
MKYPKGCDYHKEFQDTHKSWPHTGYCVLLKCKVNCYTALTNGCRARDELEKNLDKLGIK